MKVTEQLLAHLERNIDLSPAQLQKLVAEIVALLDEDEQTYIKRRYAELQHSVSSRDIWSQLADEVASGVFRGRKYSERQLKRIIYGN